MKFKAKEDFRHDSNTFEAGNTYNSGKYNLSDDEVEQFHRFGWVSLDGQDDHDRQPGAVELTPGKMSLELGVKNG